MICMLGNWGKYTYVVIFNTHYLYIGIWNVTGGLWIYFHILNEMLFMNIPSNYKRNIMYEYAFKLWAKYFLRIYLQIINEILFINLPWNYEQNIFYEYTLKSWAKYFLWIYLQIMNEILFINLPSNYERNLFYKYTF